MTIVTYSIYDYCAVSPCMSTRFTVRLPQDTAKVHR